MSFSHPKRPAYGGLRHSRSSSTLTGLTRARRSRNCFQRSPLRTSHSTQCLFPPTTTAAEEEEEDGAMEESSATLYTAVTTTTYLRLQEASSSDSEYSEYDLVNEQMQDFLLDSDDSCGGAKGEGGVLDLVPYGVSGCLPFELTEGHTLLARRRTATPQVRRRLAKKSESSMSFSSAPRMTPSTSTTLLNDLDVNVREAVALVGPSQLRSRKQRRAVIGDRRWLIPPAAPLFAEGRSTHSALLPLFTVVFDLDETLVGARYGPIHLRPHVGDLLRALHVVPVEIVVWTAGTAHYVNPILHAIGEACGRRQWFHHIISRHKRWYTGANTSVKDLSQLGRPLDRVVMIENNPISVVQQPSSCILLEDYLQPNAADNSLRVLQDILLRLVDAYTNACPTSTVSNHHVRASGSHVDDPPYNAQRVADTSLSLPALLRRDGALRPMEFCLEDLCKEDGVSLQQKVEMQERVGGATSVLCRALRYSPFFPPHGAAVVAEEGAQVSVSVRSYGCVNPMLTS